ncbi:hypothetical protein ACX2VI_001390 [Cronobacter dublinensis]
MMIVIMDVHFSLKADMTLHYKCLKSITFTMPAQLARHPPAAMANTRAIAGKPMHKSRPALEKRMVT